MKTLLRFSSHALATVIGATLSQLMWSDSFDVMVGRAFYAMCFSAGLIIFLCLLCVGAQNIYAMVLKGADQSIKEIQEMR